MNLNTRLLLSAVLALACAWGANSFDAFAQTKAPASGTSLLKSPTGPTLAIKETVQGVTFSISAPAEFTEKVLEKDDSDGTKSTSMALTTPFAKGAKTRPVLMVSVNDIKLPPDTNRIECVDAFLSSYPKTWKNYKRTPAKVVRINGKEYGFASWQGERADYGPGTYQCWVYLTIVGPRVVTLSFRDEIPSKWNERCEASAGTFVAD